MKHVHDERSPKEFYNVEDQKETTLDSCGAFYPGVTSPNAASGLSARAAADHRRATDHATAIVFRSLLTANRGNKATLAG